MRKLKTIWRLIRSKEWYVATYDRDDCFRCKSSNHLRVDFICFIQNTMMRTITNHFNKMEEQETDDALNEAQRIISEHK